MKAELVNQLRAALCVALLGLLCACGQTGPLMLPGAEPATQNGDAQPDETEEEDEED